MSPSTEPDPSHDRSGKRGTEGPPTIAEVAALTRRLRELSARGRHADPVERAAFLADKDALLARITDPAIDGADASGGEVDDGQEHGLDDDTAADEEDGPAAPVYGPDDSYWWHPGGSARLDLPHPNMFPPPDLPVPVTYDLPEPGADALPEHHTSGAVVMPNWMREHAAETAAAMAAGTAPQPHTDDPGELAARVTALHRRVTAREGATVGRQLDDTDNREDGDSAGDGSGWSR